MDRRAVTIAEESSNGTMGPRELSMINYRQNAVIARTVGVIAIALGFVSGMYGLDHPDTRWLQTALGLIATGMLAQGYALYCSIKRATNSTPPKQ